MSTEVPEILLSHYLKTIRDLLPFNFSKTSAA